MRAVDVGAAIEGLSSIATPTLGADPEVLGFS